MKFDFIFEILVMSLILILYSLFILTLNNQINKWLFTGIIWLTGIGSVLAEFFGYRNITNTGLQGTNDNLFTQSLTTLQITIYQTTNFLILYLTILIILKIFMSYQKQNKNDYSKSFHLWISLLFLAFGPLASSFLGEGITFKKELLYLPVIFTSVYILHLDKLEWFKLQFKYVLAVIVYGSVALLILRPDWSIVPYYDSWIPNINYRLVGFSTHPNALGSMGALFFLLEIWKPSSKKLVTYINYATSLIVIILSQSRTSWIALFSGLVILILYRSIAYKKQEKYYFFVFFVLITCIFVIISPDILNAIINSPSLQTLNGRLSIWNISIEIFKKYPLFGYGPSIWSEKFRLGYGTNFYWVGQSHNQYFQTLAESGLVGFAGLVTYLIYLGNASVLLAKKTTGISLSFFIFLIVRTITETPFRNNTFDNTFFMHLLVFTLLVISLNKYEAISKNVDDYSHSAYSKQS